MKGRTFTFTIADVDGDKTTSVEYTLVFADIATTGLTVGDLVAAGKATADFDAQLSTATVTLTATEVAALGFTTTDLGVYNATAKLADFSTIGTDEQST